MTDELKQQFKIDLQKLVGQKCWGIVEGKGTGSVITFDFGKQIPREKPVDNPFLSEEEQNFEAEFSLFVHCVWRVNSTQKVIFGAWTEHEAVRQEINQIVDQTIKQIELFEPTFGMKVTFSNDLQLDIFCDQTNDEDKNDNYDYFIPEIIYTVGHKSILTTSEHD